MKATETTATPGSMSSTGGADSAVESLNKPDASVEDAATTRTTAKGGSGTALRTNLRKLSNL